LILITTFGCFATGLTFGIGFETFGGVETLVAFLFLKTDWNGFGTTSNGM